MSQRVNHVVNQYGFLFIYPETDTNTAKVVDITTYGELAHERGWYKQAVAAHALDELMDLAIKDYLQSYKSPNTSILLTTV